ALLRRLQHRLLDFFEGAHLELPHPLAAYVELFRELLERKWIIGKTPRLEDTPLATVEDTQRVAEHDTALIELIALGERPFLRFRIIREPILPLPGVAFRGADRRVQRSIAGETAIHRHHLFLAHVQLLRDLRHLIRTEVALAERLNLALRLAQIEKEPLLVSGRSHLHEAPRAQDVFLDRGLDPPHGVGREPEAALW